MLSTGVSALHFLKITCKSVWVVLQRLPWIFWWCSFCTWYLLYCTFFIKWAIVFMLMLRLLWLKRFQPDLQSDDFYHSQHQCTVCTDGRFLCVITQQHCHASCQCVLYCYVSSGTGFVLLLSTQTFLYKYDTWFLIRVASERFFSPSLLFYINIKYKIWSNPDQFY